LPAKVPEKNEKVKWWDFAGTSSEGRFYLTNKGKSMDLHA
jgi:hypothetical protein